MKAVVYTQYGPPEVLQLKEIAKPQPKDNEVLIKVMATTVNRSDCAMLLAKPFIMRFGTGLFKPKNPILGTEFAGRIEAVGKHISKFKAGDDVFGFDDRGLSTYAQYLTLPETQAFTTMPESASYEQAAASIEGAHYAYNFINKVNLQTGERVLVNGASGGIGSAMVQLLKHLGAHVMAVCDTKNLERIKSIGADEVIDYLKEDFTKIDQKFHYVFDAVGKSAFGKCKPLLLPGGVYISSELGYMSQNVFLSLLTPLFGGKKVKFPIPFDRLKSIELIKKLTEEGHFKPVIDRKYQLEKIADAFDYVSKGLKTGNVVITIPH